MTLLEKSQQVTISQITNDKTQARSATEAIYNLQNDILQDSTLWLFKTKQNKKKTALEYVLKRTTVLELCRALGWKSFPLLSVIFYTV